jgi:NAD+ kinase
MKVAICSPEKENVKKILVKYGFQVVTKNPDFVICYGGDGTILYGERLYPAVPKLAVKTTEICRRCDYGSRYLSSILEEVKKENYMIVEEMKLDAYYKNKKMTSLNEVQIHTALPIRAVRFSIFVDGKKFENLIGDGVIIATPFGSTGYYLATGGRPFKEGIGISFNNLHTKKIPSFTVPEDSKIKIKMIRDSALLLSDNNPKYFRLKEGDEVVVQESEEKAKFIFVEK